VLNVIFADWIACREGDFSGDTKTVETGVDGVPHQSAEATQQALGIKTSSRWRVARLLSGLSGLRT
jgi:hypothetical protein